jgi:hypothetical protein
MTNTQIDEQKKKMFEIMDELTAKGVGINLSAQIALSLVMEKKDDKHTD